MNDSKEIKEHNACWKVSLSNGETLFEGKGLFVSTVGEASPWQRLQKYCALNEITITSLSLYTVDGRTFNLPSSGKNPRFRTFSLLPPPLFFKCERQVGVDLNKDGEAIDIEKQDLYTIAIAVYSNFELQVWVDESNTKNSWVTVKPI